GEPEGGWPHGDPELQVGEDEPSLLGDDAAGFEGAPATLGLAIGEGTASLLDAEGGAEGVGDDEALGIEELPDSEEDRGAEGLADPAGQQVDEAALPPLDQACDGDDEPIDVGIRPELGEQEP
ncbi:MAG: hypothetical protein HY744_20990, partial [Deltaproteobacteria bacterium]|nr:hypothetical protein [Deltaproteobacteria bacterium]